MSVVSLSPFRVSAPDTDVTTNDGVPVTVTGELQGQVVDPVAAALNVDDYEAATRKILQTAMRALVMKRSSAELDEGRQLHPPVAAEVVDAVRSWGVVALSLSLEVAALASR